MPSTRDSAGPGGVHKLTWLFKLFNYGLHLDTLLMCLKGGFGFHVGEIMVRFGPDVLTYFFKVGPHMLTGAPEAVILTASQSILAFSILWNASTCFSKLSVLFLYMTLMPMRSMIVPARALGGFIIVWNVGNIIGQLLICRPFALNWDQSIEGTCGSQPTYYFVMGMFNIVMDIIILAMPMPFLMKLKLATRKKLVLVGMFAVGIVWVHPQPPPFSPFYLLVAPTDTVLSTCGISVYRQVTLPGLDFSDMPGAGVVAILFSSLEPPVAISLACVPYVRAILGGRWAGGKSKYGATGDSNAYTGSGLPKGSQPLESQSHDNESEVQLQPVKNQFHVEATQLPIQDPMQGEAGREAIRIDKRWEITSNV